MPRRPRLLVAGAIYHVHSRGVRRLPIFEDDLDRRRFWTIVDEAVRRYDVSIYAACQMTNHYHFVLETPRGNLSDAIKFINSSYSQSANRRHGRRGHLFEARFDSHIVQRETYLRRSCRYVVLNPCKARLVKDAGEWPWSTYRGTAGLESPPPWLQTYWITDAFNAPTREEAQRRYRAYVNDPAARKLRVMRRNAAVIGSPSFQKVIVDTMELGSERPILAVPRLPERADLATLFAGGDQIDREAVIYTAHVVYGYFLTEIAAFLRVPRARVSRGFRNYLARVRKP